MAKAKNVDATNKATDSVAKIPEIFKIALARFQLADTENGGTPVSYGSSVGTNTVYVPNYPASSQSTSQTNHFSFTFEIKGAEGAEELESTIEQQVRNAVKRAQEEKVRKDQGRTMATYGRGRAVVS
jgi:hypothetical protein